MDRPVLTHAISERSAAIKVRPIARSALAAIQEAAKSPVPTLGYGVAYAIGNVLLALWGSVIVALM